MTKSIYDQHHAAFSNVSAYVIMHHGERVATVAFKFGESVSVYVHWMGTEMRRGRAGGGGYDRQSAACADATCKMPQALPDTSYADGTPHHAEAEKSAYLAFIGALRKDDGYHWDRNLNKAGFTVFQAV